MKSARTTHIALLARAASQERARQQAAENYVQHRDVVKLMRDSWTQDLHESYVHNLGFAKYLNIKTNDLSKYMKVKRKKLFGQ